MTSPAPFALLLTVESLLLDDATQLLHLPELEGEKEEVGETTLLTDHSVHKTERIQLIDRYIDELH